MPRSAAPYWTYVGTSVARGMTSETCAADVARISLRDVFGSSMGATPACASSGSASSSRRPFESAMVRAGTWQKPRGLTRRFYRSVPAVPPERGPAALSVSLALVDVGERWRLIAVNDGRPIVVSNDRIAIGAIGHDGVRITAYCRLMIDDRGLVGRHRRCRHHDRGLGYDGSGIVVVAVVEQWSAPVYGRRAPRERTTDKKFTNDDLTSCCLMACLRFESTATSRAAITKCGSGTFAATVRRRRPTAARRAQASTTLRRGRPHAASQGADQCAASRSQAR